MLTEKHLEELRAERRADYLAEKAREEGGAVQEAIANADAHASNVGLPSYSELAAQLQKISNCATRATSTDSTGAQMVQMRLALLEQTRELLARLPK